MKQYLGDGVYVQESSYLGSFELIVEDDMQITNCIHLEIETIQNFIDYLNELRPNNKRIDNLFKKTISR